MPNLSLILAGAVSLGSFEAGVLDELLYVLDRLNARRGADDHDRADPDDGAGPDPWRIDSIAGASAGAMTAALVAQAVMRGFQKRSLLHRAWVEEIDITRLLADIPDNALLGKTAIDRIGKEMLPYAGNAAQPAAEVATAGAAPGAEAATASSGTPSCLAGPELRLAFTVTNLSGVNYRLATSSQPGEDARFESTFYAERREFTLHRDRPDDDPWDDIRESAIASGNFPIAFQPHRLASIEDLWADHALDPFPDTFWYVDGGMFNNEPVGEAARLARKLDDPEFGARIDPDRRFLLVDANLNKPAHDPGFCDATPLFGTGKRLAVAMMGEATANDWLKALRRNNEIDWRDRLVAMIADLVRKIATDDPAALRAQVETAAEHVVRRKRAALGSHRYPASYREDAVRRLIVLHGDHAIGMSDAERKIFGHLVFLLNSAAGLDKKQQLDLSMIHADHSEMAGSELHSFAGFFSREWREHDYTVGRRKAREALPRILGLDVNDMPDPEPGVRYEPAIDMSQVTMANAPREARERMRDALMAKVEAAVGQFGIAGPLGVLNRPARWGMVALARSQVNRQLLL